MAQLAGGTQWACAELAIENNPAADTGAQREEDEVAREAAVSVIELAESSHAGVIQEVDIATETLPQDFGDGDPAPLRSQVGKEVRDAGGEVGQAGYAHAQRLGRSEFSYQSGDARQNGIGTEVGPGRDAALSENRAVGFTNGGLDVGAAEIDAAYRHGLSKLNISGQLIA